MRSVYYQILESDSNRLLHKLVDEFNNNEDNTDFKIRLPRLLYNSPFGTVSLNEFCSGVPLYDFILNRQIYKIKPNKEIALNSGLHPNERQIDTFQTKIIGNSKKG